MVRTTGEGLDIAREALAGGEIATARPVLTGLVASGGPPEAHVLLGGLCMVDDDFYGARRHWERAFRLLRDGGELPGAIRVAAELASLHTSVWANRAVARGWIERGARLVRRTGRCVEQGYLALAVLGCDQPDVTAVERNAELALDLALEFADPNLEARALAESGFAMVAQGRLADGFARLDEAMAAVTAGEVTELSVAGKCFCAMLSACDRSGEVHRAREWTAVVAEFLARHGDRPRILHTHCRAAYGSLLCSIGRWPEAEQTMLEALAPPASKAIVHRAEICAHLADLRISQGRLDEAAVLLAPFEDRLACCAALGRLHHARGDAEMAGAVLERGLSELVGDRMRAAPLLALLVEVELARDRLDAAATAAGRLAEMVSGVESALMRAEADLAAARVAAAAADYPGAVELLVTAQRHLAGEDRPVLGGLIHLELARTFQEAGEPARAVTEARAAHALFTRLGADRLADRAAAVLRSLGDRGRPARPQAAAAELSPRERDVLDLVRQGLTNAEIGERLYISAKTAEHHVSRVLAKLGVRSRAEAAAVATVVSHA